MKIKKALLPILTVALMVAMSYSVCAEDSVQTFYASVNFGDMEPSISHGDPMEEFGGRIYCVISCNMVLKPKTQIHLSRLCDSAVSNVKYYFNNSTSDVQKGPDYNNVPIYDENGEVIDEIFYPASKQIRNSYIGGKVNYKVSADFQTKKSSGEKIYKETPSTFIPVVIISSITKEVDLGVATSISVPTGDQSQPDWVGTSGVFPGFEGTYVPWTYDFGYIDDSGVSGAFGVLKAKTKNEFIVHLKSGYFGSMVNGGHIVVSESEEAITKTAFNDDKKATVLSAKGLFIQYNENEGAVDSQGNVVIEDGWAELPKEYKYLFNICDDGNISYPATMNAWIRVSAVMEEPTADDCKPVRRTIVKGRIGTKYPGFEFKNMKEGDVLKIYNVNGKKIREITSGTAEGFVWDGKNDSGDWAKSGIYIYQIKIDGKLISGTIVFVY